MLLPNCKRNRLRCNCLWFLDVFSGIRPACSAGFLTCRAADFQIGTGWNVAAGAGLEGRDTADLEVNACQATLGQWGMFGILG